MCKEKRKMNMLEYDIEVGVSDQEEFNMTKCNKEPSKLRSDTHRRAIKSANQKLHQSTCQKNAAIWFMTHHYAYMAKVVEVCKLESYTEVVKDANWLKAMEEEM